MVQRASGYVKKDLDFYPTLDRWVVKALAEHLKIHGLIIWECAAGTGELCESLRHAGARSVLATDVYDHGYAGLDGIFDFASVHRRFQNRSFHGIVTNPPFGDRGTLAETFVERGLWRMGTGQFMALLLPIDFDSAKTRAKFFEDCPHFAGSISLTKRPKWFDGPVPCKKCGGGEVDGIRTVGTGQVDGKKCKSCGGKGQKKSGPSSNSAWFIWRNSPLLAERGRHLKLYAPGRAVDLKEAA